jgi:3-isopropylmalate/(R)-2-methylmalate dehydratase small subunit
MTLRGKAHVYGDDIDTDRIIPGKYTKTLDLNELAAHCLEDLDPTFRSRVSKGDWLVAGNNFGCGSSREQAPLALRTVGISGVIAKYFARIFFRNAINIGLPVLEVPDFDAEPGDEISVDLSAGRVENVTRGKTYQASALPDVMLDILREGGLVAYLKNHGTYKTTT